jgi:hypothetical protein
MDQNSSSRSATPLSSHDLEEIDRFHIAWCEENGVERTDIRAIEVASALLDWYSRDPTYRMRAKLDHPPALPQSAPIETLLHQLK